MEQKLKMEVYTDFIWPYCYLGTVRVDSLQKDYDLEVTWRFFPLHPEIPEEGMTLQEYFKDRYPQIQQGQINLKKQFAAEGLDYNEKGNFICNTRKAQELAFWARENNCASNLHDLLYKAVFLDAANLSDEKTLLDIAEKAGLDRTRCAEVLGSGEVKEALDAEWHESRQRGVSSIPLFLSGNQAMVGAQAYDRFCAFMDHVKSLN